MNIDQIIAKVLAGSSAGEELSAVEQWKQEAEENAKALADMQKIAALSESLKGYQDFGDDKAWTAMEEVISNFEDAPASVVSISSPVEQKMNTKTFNIKRWSRAAAVLVVLLAATFGFHRFSKASAGSFKVEEFSAIDAKQDVKLYDGSVVTLDHKGKLRARGERAVSLKGRAYFDVKTDASHPFEVKLPVGTIEVLGTRFSVIGGDSVTEVYLVEGSVRFLLRGQEWKMKPGECLRVIDGAVEIAEMKDKNRDSWIDGKLVFDDDSMQEVVETLSRHFDQNIMLKDVNLFKNCNVKTSFDGHNLSEILNEFVTTHGLEYQKQGNTYIVTGSKC